MNSNLRQKIPKYKSRAGMSLTELIVGVTIIALVLGSAAGAIVTGYKTTIDNAERNRVAAMSASMNEVIMKAVKNCAFSNKHEASKHFLKSDIFPADTSTESPSPVPMVTDDNLAAEPVHQAALSLFSKTYMSTMEHEEDMYVYQNADVQVTYVANEVNYASVSFPDANYEVQYCLILDSTRHIQTTKDVPINGIEIRTVVYTSSQIPEEVVSFVPYKTQKRVK